MSEVTDSEALSDLLARAISGEKVALAELHRRYRAQVLSAVRCRLSRKLRRRFDSSDIVQSVFAEVLRDLPRFEDRGEPAFRRWLYVKAESKVSQKLRRHVGRGGERWEQHLASHFALPDASPSPPSQMVHDEDVERIRTLVDRLDGVTRSVVELRTREGLSFGAIARTLNLPSEDAARKRYSRALVKLRSEWEEA